MFCNYMTWGNLNMGAAVREMRCANPMDDADLGTVAGDLFGAGYAEPKVIVPVSGSVRVLAGSTEGQIGAGVESSLYSDGAMGTMGALAAMSAGVTVNGKPMIGLIRKPGGAFAVLRAHPRMFFNADGSPIAGDLAIDRARGALLIVWLLQNAGTRPVIAVDTVTGEVWSKDRIVGHVLEHEGRHINGCDVLAVSAAAANLGLRLEPKAKMPILNPNVGSAYDAIKAAYKMFAVGAGIPNIDAVVNTADGMLSHPTARALLSWIVPMAQALGWDNAKLSGISIAAPFMVR